MYSTAPMVSSPSKKTRRCAVLYTKNSLKKNKIWHDGSVVYQQAQEILDLYDQDGVLLHSQKILHDQWNDAKRTGSTLDAGQYLVTVEETADLSSLSPIEPEPDQTKPQKKKPLHLEPPPVKYNYAHVPKDAIEVAVLFTDQKHKKHKTWKDGLLHYYEGKNKALLYDLDHAFQDSIVLSNLIDFCEQGTLETERFIVQYADKPHHPSPDEAAANAFVKSSYLLSHPPPALQSPETKKSKTKRPSKPAGKQEPAIAAQIDSDELINTTGY